MSAAHAFVRCSSNANKTSRIGGDLDFVSGLDLDNEGASFEPVAVDEDRPPPRLMAWNVQVRETLEDYAARLGILFRFEEDLQRHNAPTRIVSIETNMFYLP